ncbi:molybdenum-cofactor-assembly chaperone subunit (delta subunit) of nitrate reductase 1 [Crenothrix polyspora]|uniref:Molybdenum-cofactor-assembly chaperone subunit (Delta subunit) of nitrate reductase 1 n=1 Tax=Crenothrix polyspora TaxID=360316 RepID=A0A1R4H1S6_9GAMM|nr:nitrate reductase molybdenum cofactor assembly chaperone [Crenothrix polyspora]SJM90197.1 molybdenum-cofactor-assembly chaperone subunit (delta subunit) of nitrate reductase 1 [Crenothrix polyspora]
MQTLKVLSLLLSYPEAETLEALDEMAAVVEQENLLLDHHKKSVLALIDTYRGTDLLDAQEAYVALFDRGRFLSLHIFEHVHGESRDRGQAMVNLLQMYESHGFEMSTHELPDYIPLFLEFLSQQERAEAAQLLHDAMPVLSLLGARLIERGNDFRAIFDALAGFAGEPEALAEIRQQAATEGEDETLVNMDEIWEEEAVSFMGSGDVCTNQTAAATVNPVIITSREQFLAAHSNRK